MLSVAKHLVTQSGNVCKTWSSIGAGSLKVAHQFAGTTRPLPQLAGPRPQADLIHLRDSTRPARILSLDGDGVCVYSALLILRAFMQRLQSIQGNGQEILPADFFDLIIGTGTGGLVALMLGRLRMKIDDCITDYELISSKIFGSGGPATMVFSGGLLGKGLGLGLGMGVVEGRSVDRFVNLAANSMLHRDSAMYDCAKLEKHIKRIIKRQTHTWGDENALLEDISNNCHTAVVTAYHSNPNGHHIMSSYSRPDGRIMIWEAARAACAAPGLFLPIAVGVPKIPYVNGGLSGHWNPSSLVQEEVEKIWPRREICLLLSLGTGSLSEVRGTTSSRLKNFSLRSADAGRMHETVARFYNQTYESGCSPYVRLSVEKMPDKVRLDSFKDVPKIAAATQEYLEKSATADLLARAAELGAGRARIMRKNLR
ncbi:hypothetical protein FS749_003939 [Ceratobasidium sp. UAMH 11750]|nr:hypothetical protein FS749_003939 [Ceratobasidium sp. UAMH 11750]